MAFGDYRGPNKPNKGHEGGACNRESCQAEPALFHNTLMPGLWYCEDCAHDIGEDRMNRLEWAIKDFPKLLHARFETREMMDYRETLDMDPNSLEFEWLEDQGQYARIVEDSETDPISVEDVIALEFGKCVTALMRGNGYKTREEAESTMMSLIRTQESPRYGKIMHSSLYGETKPKRGHTSAVLHYDDAVYQTPYGHRTPSSMKNPNKLYRKSANRKLRKKK